jgi:hypothetical protein
MTIKTSKNIFEILLPNALDGDKIENFITEYNLRSDEVRIYGNGNGNDETFQSGESYRVILIGSDTRSSGKKSAVELAKEFNGFLI